MHWNPSQGALICEFHVERCGLIHLEPKRLQYRLRVETPWQLDEPRFCRTSAGVPAFQARGAVDSAWRGRIISWHRHCLGCSLGFPREAGGGTGDVSVRFWARTVRGLHWWHSETENSIYRSIRRGLVMFGRLGDRAG